MGLYNPRSILRKLSPDLRGELGRRRAEGVEGWGNADLSMRELFAEWQALPPDVHGAVDRLLQGIHALASSEAFQIIVDEARALGLDVCAPTQGMESLADRALWVELNHPALFARALRFAHADDSARGRSWHKRLGLPPGKADLSADALGEFLGALRAYYNDNQGRGQRIHLEPVTRSDGTHYIFGLLSDYADRLDTVDESGQRVPRPGDPSFEVVFAWRDGAATLEICAGGGKPVIDALRTLFCRTLFKADPLAEDERQPPFNLDALLRSPALPTDPEDGIRAVLIRELDLDVVGRKDKSFTVKSRSPDDPHHIHHLIDDDLNRRQLPRSVLVARRAVIQILFVDGGGLRFTVSRNSCNLKSQSESLRMLGEKCLLKWGVDVTGTPLDVREYTGTVA